MSSLLEDLTAIVLGEDRPAEPPPAPEGPPAQPHLPYQPALDGLRGLAVAAVLAYHAELSWAKGGFLGVDAFFVLSGYLITSLLLLEWRGRGSVNLLSFWGRRARRLLPALFLLLAGVAVYAVVFAKPEQMDRIRSDALATLFYVANWHYVIADVSYFDIFSLPSPLRHTWSLAIEEQFYLIWPPLLFVALSMWRGSPRAITASTVALVAGSALLMALLYEPRADPSRVYYGTDTRAQSLLVGATLAMMLIWFDPIRTLERHRLLQLVALPAAAVAAWLWLSTPDTSSFLYRGGYLLLAVAVALVIAAVVQPRGGALRSALSFEPLRRLGLISYGVYLWHWPIYLILTSDRTGLDGIDLLAYRVVVTIAISTASYLLVETPIRRGTLRLPRLSWAAVPASAVGLAVVLILVTRGGAPPFTTPGETESAIAAHARSERTGATRVLLVGDSVAFTLAEGLFQLEDQFGFVLQNVSAPGCGVREGEVVANGKYVPREGCDAIPERWEKELDQFQPQVVVILLSGWDGSTFFKNGRSIAPRTREAREAFSDGLLDAFDTLSSGGARVVLLTAPYTDVPAMDVETIDWLNGLAVEAARDAPEPVSVVDLNKFLGPDGVYTPALNGVRVRDDDNVHFSEEGAAIVGGWLMPRILDDAGVAAR